MRQTLNLRLTGTFSLLVCSLMTRREIGLLSKIHYRLSLLPHLSGSNPRTLMLSKSPAVHNVCRHICSSTTRLLSSEGTLEIVCSPCKASSLAVQTLKKKDVCQFQVSLMIHFDSFGFVVLSFLLCL